MASTQPPDTTTQKPFPAPTLPSPQTFDILPALHELLARLEHHPDTDPSIPTGAAYKDTPPLEPKNLPTEVLAIKSKIRRALRELEKLPDMDRSVEDLEREIRILKERERRQREVLAGLGRVVGELQGRGG